MWCDVMVLYELALMGAASDAQAGELQKDLTQVIAPFGLRLGHEVEYRGRTYRRWREEYFSVSTTTTS